MVGGASEWLPNMCVKCKNGTSFYSRRCRPLFFIFAMAHILACSVHSSCVSVLGHHVVITIPRKCIRTTIVVVFAAKREKANEIYLKMKALHCHYFVTFGYDRSEI